MLNEEIEETEREIVFLMGEVGESRSKETGNHVKPSIQSFWRIVSTWGLKQI